MASIEKRGDSFRLVFRFAGKRFRRSLKTTDDTAAQSALARLKDNLRRVDLGLLDVPSNADVVTFLVSDGRTAAVKRPKATLTLKQLFDSYFAAIPEGNLEPTTLATMQQHVKQLYAHFGESFSIRTLTLADLQQFVEKRARHKNQRGKPIKSVTIKKGIVTLRTAWNWAVQNELIERRFPNKGLKYPKSKEKPPFQTIAEIEARIKNLPTDEAAELWECTFLTIAEVTEVLKFVKDHARQPFIYPFFVFAAHTGARRSEIVRSKLSDIDFKANTVTIHERKKCHDRHTSRLVPMSPLLRSVLKAWIAVHPGGEFTFAQAVNVQRSKTRRVLPTPITRDEAHDHFKRTLAASRFSMLRGWHVFRHSFASNSAAAGIDQRIINEWLGHLSDEQVRRYRHLIPNQAQEAIRLVFATRA